MSWLPKTPAGGTEIMESELKDRLGPDLDKINLRLNMPDLRHDRSKPHVVWVHLDANQPCMNWCRWNNLTAAVDWFVFVSQWQLERYVTTFDLPRDKCVVLRNATSCPAKIRAWQPHKPWRCAYTSTPFRGLSVLLETWKNLPGIKAELHIWSSMKIYCKSDQPFVRLYDLAHRMPGVFYHGIVPNDELQNELQDIDFLVYPSIFAETACLAAIEAMSAGCRLIVPEFGALPETTAGYARTYRWSPSIEEHAVTLARVLVDELTDPWQGKPGCALYQQRYCAENYDWAVRIPEWRQFIASVVQGS